MLGGMKLQDIPTSELRRVLRATERDAGPDSMEARVLRQELAKREHPARQHRLGRMLTERAHKSKGGRGA